MDGWMTSCFFSLVLATFFFPCSFHFTSHFTSRVAFKDCSFSALLHTAMRYRGRDLGASVVAIWSFYDGCFDFLLQRLFFRLDLHLASTEEWNSDAIFYRTGTTIRRLPLQERNWAGDTGTGNGTGKDWFGTG
jgi:hypothetical protein